MFLQEDCPVCHPATSRPPSVMDLSCQYGAPTSAMPTPVIRRPRAAPSPAPGRPGSFVQRYHRRPVTVSIDDTLSGKASSFLPSMSGHGRAKTKSCAALLGAYWAPKTLWRGPGGNKEPCLADLTCIPCSPLHFLAGLHPSGGWLRLDCCTDLWPDPLWHGTCLAASEIGLSPFYL